MLGRLTKPLAPGSAFELQAYFDKQDRTQPGLMSKTDEDSRADFRDVCDLDRSLVDGFRIQLDEVR